MTRRRAPDSLTIGLATLAALVMAGLSFSLLSALSTPPRLKQRLAAIEGTIEQTRGAFRPSATSGVYLRHALCRRSYAGAEDIVRTELAGAASGAGLSSAQIGLTSATMADMTERAYPVMFTVEATDRYDLVLGFLQRLAAAEPQVFADTVDLTSKTSAVSLKLTGRVLCEPGT